MLLKRPAIATVLLTLAISGCKTYPWNARVDDELNLAISFRNNQLVIPSTTIDSREGKFILGSATPELLLSPRFIEENQLRPRRRVRVRLAEKQAISVAPFTADLKESADGVLGISVWRNGSISIDYNNGLLSYSNVKTHVTSDMIVTRFENVPMVQVVIDGVTHSAIVDTTVPDTLIVPSATGAVSERRTRVDLVVGGHRFPNVSARVAPGSSIRIGNRVLSKFLVAIDYRTRKVGLWRDPRTSEDLRDR